MNFYFIFQFYGWQKWVVAGELQLQLQVICNSSCRLSATAVAGYLQLRKKTGVLSCRLCATAVASYVQLKSAVKIRSCRLCATAVAGYLQLRKKTGVLSCKLCATAVASYVQLELQVMCNWLTLKFA